MLKAAGRSLKWVGSIVEKADLEDWVSEKLNEKTDEIVVSKGTSWLNKILGRESAIRRDIAIKYSELFRADSFASFFRVATDEILYSQAKGLIARLGKWNILQDRLIVLPIAALEQALSITIENRLSENKNLKNMLEEKFGRESYESHLKVMNGLWVDDILENIIVLSTSQTDSSPGETGDLGSGLNYFKVDEENYIVDADSTLQWKVEKKKGHFYVAQFHKHRIKDKKSLDRKITAARKHISDLSAQIFEVNLEELSEDFDKLQADEELVEAKVNSISMSLGISVR